MNIDPKDYPQPLPSSEPTKTAGPWTSDVIESTGLEPVDSLYVRWTNREKGDGAAMFLDLGGTGWTAVLPSVLADGPSDEPSTVLVMRAPTAQAVMSLVDEALLRHGFALEGEVFARSSVQRPPAHSQCGGRSWL